MSIEEQKIFREYASESGYYRLYLVGLGTGMRSGELRALNGRMLILQTELYMLREL